MTFGDFLDNVIKRFGISFLKNKVLIYLDPDRDKTGGLRIESPDTQAEIRFNLENKKWEISTDDINWLPINTSNEIQTLQDQINELRDEINNLKQNNLSMVIVQSIEQPDGQRTEFTPVNPFYPDPLPDVLIIPIVNGLHEWNYIQTETNKILFETAPLIDDDLKFILVKKILI